MQRPQSLHAQTVAISQSIMLHLLDSNKQIHLSTEWHGGKTFLYSTYLSKVGSQCSNKPVSSTMSWLHILSRRSTWTSSVDNLNWEISIGLAWRATWAETELPWMSAVYVMLSGSQCLPRFAEQGRPNMRMAPCMMVNSWMISEVVGVCKSSLTSPRMRASGRMTRCKVQALNSL